LIDNPNYQDFATHDDSAYPELWGGCVGAWAPCLGPSGLRLHEHSGRANWGTLTSMDAATDWVVDGGKYALDFDGSNDYVDLGVIPLHPGVSLTFWAKFGTVNTTGSIFSDTNVGGFPKLLQVEIGRTSGRIGVLWGGVIVHTSPTSLSANRWYFIAVTQRLVSGGWEASIFINGVFDSSAITAVNPTVGERFSIGRPGSINLQYMQAMVDDLQFRNFAIFPLSVQQLYSLGRGAIYTPRRRRRIYSIGPSFNAAWARGSNVILQPSVGVA